MTTADTSDLISPATPREHVAGPRRETMAKRMAEDYAAGLTVADVGKKYGRSYGATHAMLTEHGVTLRKRGGGRRSLP